MVKQILTTDTSTSTWLCVWMFFMALQKLHPARKRMWFYTSQSDSLSLCCAEMSSLILVRVRHYQTVCFPSCRPGTAFWKLWGFLSVKKLKSPATLAEFSSWEDALSIAANGLPFLTEWQKLQSRCCGSVPWDLWNGGDAGWEPWDVAASLSCVWPYPCWHGDPLHCPA